ncbi:MAG: hypothetical protein KGJ11_00470 [Candidatus Omnitrophica bacterium]|nr:hypothetical protein [Candidatus Omnitrophota bacterium]
MNVSKITLESDYIKYLDYYHFKGYAHQLLHDDEKKYYQGMQKYFSEKKGHEDIVDDTALIV